MSLMRQENSCMQMLDESMESGEVGSNGTEGQLPSCDGCRVRKLKCSREKPSCTNCTRLDIPCTYDSSRSKPGLKRGTIDKLSRRIDIIERTLFTADDETILSPPSEHATRVPPSGTHSHKQDDPSTAALSLLAREIQKLNQNICALAPPLPPPSATTVPQTVTPSTSADEGDGLRSGKRQRFNAEHEHTRLGRSDIGVSEVNAHSDHVANLLSGRNLELLVDAYFNNVQGWAPNIHQAWFRRKLLRPDGAKDHALILDAMLVAALRFVDPSARQSCGDKSNERVVVELARQRVMLTAMNDISVQNLQALTIIAYTHIGDGEPAKAWPIVASLTRTVDFLQLSIENENKAYPQAFLMPPSLPPPADWTEEEERRRVFWNIFILDRICCVTTGWNIGLTADNVSRRLPINGSNWTDERPALAPFFGMWDKSAAKIGNSVAFLPAHYPSPAQSSETNGSQYDGASVGNQKLHVTPQAAPMDASTIGAFAYYVESLESLCRINIYFLQQKIDFTDRQEVSNWLTRFKELDLRLIHWKMFLPAKWRDPNVPRERATTALDPNMSLAHITHNTSMILLHQRIAYPELMLKSIKLANFHSAETCQSAAIETTLSAVKYLALAAPNTPVSPHFSFCVYVSARVLLVHCSFYGLDLDPQFWTLIECLQEMSSRWRGLAPTADSETPPLPAQLATQLQGLYERYRAEPNFCVGVVGSIDSGPTERLLPLADNMPHSPAPLFGRSARGNNISSNSKLPTAANGGEFTTPPQPGGSPAHLVKGAMVASEEAPAVENSLANWNSPLNVSESWGQSSSKGPDDLTNIISALTDQRFMEMDRVITFNDFGFETLPTAGLEVP